MSETVPVFLSKAILAESRATPADQTTLANPVDCPNGSATATTATATATAHHGHDPGGDEGDEGDDDQEEDEHPEDDREKEGENAARTIESPSRGAMFLTQIGRGPPSTAVVGR
jgi:hypothetical protein